MKRTAMLFTVILALVLIGYPSIPLRADSAKSHVSAGVDAGDDHDGGTSGAGNGNGTSGQNEGDADGLAGIRRPGLYGDGDGVGLVLRTWWKILWLLR